ncbi:ABC-three component system middle component 6 [Methylosinus sp. Ce-a6]|uniref:ABC-three component system middle component 6 n=1 Tax=Methylosinus sp. Ce-a6 TaxID=2172005 RepID=UPI0027E3F02A|nr:ABC-three component system middle component 6 [Methylosinus sp. Ce-a6]
MILPSKHVSPERALIGVGAEILDLLSTPRTVSGLWDGVRRNRSQPSSFAPIDYNWFILSLDLLHLLGVVRFEKGVLYREKP